MQWIKYILHGRNISMNENDKRYDYTEKYNKNELQATQRNKLHISGGKEQYDMKVIRAYNFDNKKLCYVVF